MTRRRTARQVFLMVLASITILTPFLIYVWGRIQIVDKGYRIEEADSRLQRLEQDNRALRLEKARLEAAPRIESEGRKLGLEPLTPSRIVTLADPSALRERRPPEPPRDPKAP